MRSFTVVLFFAALALPRGAVTETPKVGVEANTSFWWTVFEQVENGLVQSGSEDPAADEASGFSFRQGRVAFHFESPEGSVEALLRIRLEERTDIIDFWGTYHAAPWLSMSIGQMKIPSTAEVLTQDHMLDFVSRTTFGRNVGDYALSRTPYISSIMAATSYNRDFGIALEGRLMQEEAPSLRYFLMIGNGIGANRYIGGRESDEFLYTNEFGHFYYGLRLEMTPVPWSTFGAHCSLNKHDNVALDERGPVFDIDRTVWTADCRVTFPWKQRIVCFYGKGGMDDFWDAHRYQFDYDGWGLWTLRPFLRNSIELGLRYDTFTTEFNRDGNETTQRNWTVGVNASPHEHLRLQLNYVAKQTVNDFEPDVEDNILYLNVQFLFHARLVE